MRILARLSVPALVVLGALGCSGQDGGSGCGEGFTERSRTNEVDAPGADTREDAIRAELVRLGFEASDVAIAGAVVNSKPAAGDSGREAVSVSTSEGIDIEMTLAPLDPGWAVDGSSWCVPGDQ